MKKRLLAIIAVISAIMMLAGSVSAAGTKRDGAETAVAYQTTETITLDGKADEAAWASAVEIPLDTITKGGSWSEGDELQDGSGTPDPAKAGVAGDRYAKASMKLLWNGSNELYVMFIIENPRRGLNKTTQADGSAIEDDWQKDRVFWYFNLDNGTTKPTGGTSVDKAWTYSIDNGNVSPAQNPEPITAVIERKIKLTDANTAGSYIGFDVQVNDNPGSNKGRRVALTWAAAEAIASEAEIDWANLGQIYLSTSKVTDTNKDDGTGAGNDAANSSEVADNSSEVGNATDSGSSAGGENGDTSDYTAVAVAAAAVFAAAVVVGTKRRK